MAKTENFRPVHDIDIHLIVNFPKHDSLSNHETFHQFIWYIHCRGLLGPELAILAGKQHIFKESVTRIGLNVVGVFPEFTLWGALSRQDYFPCIFFVSLKTSFSLKNQKRGGQVNILVIFGLRQGCIKFLKQPKQNLRSRT